MEPPILDTSSCLFLRKKDLSFDELADPLKKIAIPQHGPQNKLTKLCSYGHKISKRFTQTNYNKAHTLAIKLAIYSEICYNQLQKYLRHCNVFWHKWPVHELVLVIPPPPLIKAASNTRPCSKLGGTTLNGREEGGQYYISQTCDQERFEPRKVGFSWECLNIFATGCSFLAFPANWEACSLPSALRLTYCQVSYTWLICSLDHK